MKIALIQMEIRSWSTGSAVEKIKSACQRAKELGCVAAFTSGGFKAVRDNCASAKNGQLAVLAEEVRNVLPLFIGSVESDDGVCLLQDGIVLKLRDSLEFANRLLIFSNEVCQAAEPVWEIFLKPSPWRPKGEENLWKRLSRIARGNKSWVFQANLCGGMNEDVFAGGSVVFNPAGEMVALGNFFDSDLIIIDTDTCAPIPAPVVSSLEMQWLAAVTGTRDFIRAWGNGKAVLGLSGGMDSALVACIAAEALGPENVMAVLMPSRYTSAESVRDAQELAGNLGMNAFSMDIAPMQAAFAAQLEPVLAGVATVPGHFTWENLQARIRGVLLMAISNATGALTLNTGNKSEAEMGYCTLYGDMVGALSVIGDLYKTRVYELARWYCEQKGKMIIPENIFLREPTAELAPGQKDSDILPPYPELDSVLAWLHDPDLPRPQSSRVEEIRQKKCRMAYKRKYLPPALRIGE